MIAIKFSPKYEDRVSIFLRNEQKLKTYGINYTFKDTPSGEHDFLCYWLFEYFHSKQVNVILSALKDLKSIMGVEDLEFQYCHNEKEFYCQYDNNLDSIHWFKV